MSEKIARYWSSQPARFRYLEGVDLRRVLCAGAANPYGLSITLREQPDTHAPGVRLEFLGVRGFRLEGVDGLLGALFEIVDETESQLEGIRYRVTESEHNSCSFWCRDFEVHLL